MNGTATVAEALRLHYAGSALPVDGGRSARSWAPLKHWPRLLGLGNYMWRRRALAHHDVHHVLTGYACNAAGEMEIAAWEFAAGRFPSVGSTLFCLPLIGFGAMLIPERSFAAFLRGRHSRTLYATPLTELLPLQVRELRGIALPRAQPEATLRDCIDYLALASLSLSFIIVPIVAIRALIHWG